MVARTPLGILSILSHGQRFVILSHVPLFGILSHGPLISILNHGPLFGIFNHGQMLVKRYSGILGLDAGRLLRKAARGITRGS